ncbi:MAG: histidine--tRNA ligase [Nitrospirales bacterium]|nr:histidine--tRNA ligase [Nitrospirales bacterium]
MKYSALKGVRDILSPETGLWQRIEATAGEVFRRYGFQEVRLPIIESTELFTRGIGEATDIVEKEMYTFQDKGNRSISMRPEGTAPAVRCYIENKLHLLPAPQKLFYSGPMFRYERPQKGRFRQFYQIGAEAFGVAHPSMDAEIITMITNILSGIGLSGLNCEINSIGCDDCRPVYRTALKDFFAERLPDFCPDCQRRYETNPLRILDCKVPRCIELRKGAPLVSDHLCGSCGSHFQDVLSRLRLLGVPFTLNPNLVRGLDYYTRTAFEITSENLGAQKAVAAGGRYDKLVAELGGPVTPAIGFALGMERIATLLMERGALPAQAPDIVIATLGAEAENEGARLTEVLRAEGLWVEHGYGASALKTQLKRADRIGTRFALIIGEDELKTGLAKLKDLGQGSQSDVALADPKGIVNLVRTASTPVNQKG